MYSPKNFAAFSSQSLPILSNGILSIDMFSRFKSHFLCLGLMTIYFVLLAFKDNLFAQNHENSYLICLRYF